MIFLTQNSNIRRIDELGRVVIPKDIRKKLHIKDNEPLEIFIDNDEIKIRKYSSLPDIIEFIKKLIDIGNRITGNSYIVTDREKIIASTDETFEAVNLDSYLENLVFNCQEEKNSPFEFQNETDKISGFANIVPIIIDNDRCGLIIEYAKNKELKTQDTIKIFKNLVENSLSNY